MALNYSQPVANAVVSHDGRVKANALLIGADSNGAVKFAITAIPRVSSLAYLTLWPTGQSRPAVSTLNSWTGAIVANAAIATIGSMGNIDVFVTDEADVIIDINGYFADPSGGGRSFYPVNPCRVQQEWAHQSGTRSYSMVSGARRTDRCPDIPARSRGFPGYEWKKPSDRGSI